MRSAWLGGGHDGWVVRGVPVGFAFERWDVADLAVETGRVVPVDPFDGGELGMVPSLPGSSSSDQFDLVGPIECFGHGVVI